MIDPRNRCTPRWIKGTTPGKVFVYGSNLAGRNGKGAALVAKKEMQARDGIGFGMSGPYCYAIPFKDGRFPHDRMVRKVLPLQEIQAYVNQFIDYAKRHPELIFHVIEVGCGEAGYTPGEVAPLFKTAEDVTNITLPDSFWLALEKEKIL
jgi:hypothetical protein